MADHKAETTVKYTLSKILNCINWDKASFNAVAAEGYILSAIEAATKEKDEERERIEDELWAKVKRHRATIKELERDIEKKDKTIARLLAVIEPFAKMYRTLSIDGKSKIDVPMVTTMIIDNLRAAASVYEEVKDG